MILDTRMFIKYNSDVISFNSKKSCFHYQTAFP